MAHRSAKELNLPTGDAVLDKATDEIRYEPTGFVQGRDLKGRQVLPADNPNLFGGRHLPQRSRPDITFAAPTSNQSVQTSHTDKAKGYLLSVMPFVLATTIAVHYSIRAYWDLPRNDEFVLAITAITFALCWFLGGIFYTLTGADNSLLVFEIFEYLSQRREQRERENYFSQFWDKE